MTTWTPDFSYAIPGTGTAKGQVGGGWTDPGSLWEVASSGGILQYDSPASIGAPWTQGQLVRKAAGEACVNQRVQATFVSYTSPDDFYVWLRYSGPDATAHGYAVKPGQMFAVQNGNLGGTQTGAGSIAFGQNYDIQVDCVQNANGLTTITETTWLSDGTQAFATGSQSSSNTYTDSTADLQNLSGGQGFFFTGAHGQGSNIVRKFASFSGDAAASGGGTAPPAGPLLAMTDASTVMSPHNWTLVGSGARTWNAGAYVRFYVQGTTSASLLTGPGGAAYCAIQIDDTVVGNISAVPSSGSIAVTLPDTGAHVVTAYLVAIPQTAGRWAGTNCMAITGLQLGSGGTGAPSARGARNILIHGDSITEGIQADNGNDNNLYDWSFLVGQGLLRAGYEYGIVACGYSAYAGAVGDSAGGTPAAYVPGNDGASWWNKIDGTGAKRTTGAGAAERYIVQPDIIVDVWGANDGLSNFDSATVQAAIQGLYAGFRTAAPNAVLINVVPFGGYVRAAIVAAMAALPPDSKRSVVDLAIDQRQAAYGGVHPGRIGHAQIAGMLLPRIMAAYLPWATARAFSS